MVAQEKLNIDPHEIRAFCEEHGIRRLSLFGSILTDQFGPQSDIDVLVEFNLDKIPSLLGMARLERELASLFDGRKVDLRTPEDLSRYFRQAVMAEAELQYAQS